MLRRTREMSQLARWAMSEREFMPLMCRRRRVVVRSKGVVLGVEEELVLVEEGNGEELRVRRRVVARGTWCGRGRGGAECVGKSFMLRVFAESGCH